MVENLVSMNIKTFHSDGGDKFMHNQSSPFLETNGTLCRLSCPYIAQQNGLAERKHRHIVEIGLVILAQFKLPFEYLG